MERSASSAVRVAKRRVRMEVMVFPSSSTAPSDGVMMRAVVLSRVDLPRALAPMITVVTPLGTLRVTPSTTIRLPYPECSSDAVRLRGHGPGAVRSCGGPLSADADELDDEVGRPDDAGDHADGQHGREGVFPSRSTPRTMTVPMNAAGTSRVLSVRPTRRAVIGPASKDTKAMGPVAAGDDGDQVHPHARPPEHQDHVDGRRRGS